MKTIEDMPMILLSKQREFLEYLRDKHNSIGYGGTIDIILSSNQYTHDQSNPILQDWKIMIQDPNCTDCREYGIPVKYRK